MKVFLKGWIVILSLGALLGLAACDKGGGGGVAPYPTGFVGGYGSQLGAVNSAILSVSDQGRFKSFLKDAYFAKGMCNPYSWYGFLDNWGHFVKGSECKIRAEYGSQTQYQVLMNLSLNTNVPGAGSMGTIQFMPGSMAFSQFPPLPLTFSGRFYPINQGQDLEADIQVKPGANFILKVIVRNAQQGLVNGSQVEFFYEGARFASATVALGSSYPGYGVGSGIPGGGGYYPPYNPYSPYGR